MKTGNTAMATLALPCWQGRVSPVLDVAKEALLVEFDAAGQRSVRSLSLAPGPPWRRAEQLAAAGAQVVVCGALSCAMEAALAAAGMRVVPHVCGDTAEIIDAYAAGSLADPKFLMPGCRLQRRGRCCRRRGRNIQA